MNRLSFFLCCVLIIVFWNCGKQSDGSSRIDITVWAHEGQPDEKKALVRIADRFNTGQDSIRIVLRFKQEQGYDSRINAAAMAGELPDILDIDGPYTARFADMGILVPLAPLLSDSMVNDFLPTILQQGTFRDTLYTLGAFESTVALFYNRAVFDSCNLEPVHTVDSAWQWDHFLAALRTIQKHYPDLLPLETFMTWGGEWLTYAYTPPVWSNRGRLVAPDTTAVQGYLNGPQAVSALSAWQMLFTENLANADATPGLFEAGKAAMAWGIFNRWPIYSQSPIQFGIMPLPVFETPVSPSGSWCWSITTACRNRKAAAAVLTHLLHPEQGIVPMCRANGGIPSRHAAVRLMPEYRETRGLFIDQLTESGRARPVTPHYGTLTAEMSRALSDIANGTPAQQALNRAARRIAKVF